MLPSTKNWMLPPLIREGASFAMACYSMYWWWLLFSNAEIPLRPEAPYVLLLPVTLGTGVVAYWALPRLCQCGAVSTTVLFIVSTVLGWWLWPTVCDTHESFVDVPNQRCVCHGLSFAYYQRGMSDGASFDMCVGPHQPIAP